MGIIIGAAAGGGVLVLGGAAAAIYVARADRKAAGRVGPGGKPANHDKIVEAWV